jgi:hypothetical protein
MLGTPDGKRHQIHRLNSALLDLIFEAIDPLLKGLNINLKLSDVIDKLVTILISTECASVCEKPTTRFIIGICMAGFTDKAKPN